MRAIWWALGAVEVKWTVLCGVSLKHKYQRTTLNCVWSFQVKASYEKAIRFGSGFQVWIRVKSRGQGWE